MTPEKLLEFATCLRDADHQHIEVLESSYREATRFMSMAGLSTYLEGMRAMCSLGKNQDLLLTYVEEMPAVAREVGEDVIFDIVSTIMNLSRHTSGSVITLVLSEMPHVARRLADADVIRGYLNLLQNLGGKAPRGLRPMMENLDELLSKLTLGGLRRWALWGAQAHARDLDGQVAYFGLQTESSRSIMQKERRGTLFVDNQRMLNLYLRALWARAFFMRPTSGDYENREGTRPYIEDYQIHLPDAFDDFQGIRGIEIYRASAAHCVAHLIHTEAPFEVDGLSVAQMECVDLFEDARIEHLAIQRFPGLRKLWLRFFQAPQQDGSHEAVSCMLQLSRALLDDSDCDNPSFILQLAIDYRKKLDENADNSQIALEAGLAFYEHLIKHTAFPSLQILQDRNIPYRDDNRHCWAFSEDNAEQFDMDLNNFEQRKVRRNVELTEVADNLENELTGDDAQDVWTQNTEFWLELGNGTIDDLEGREPVSDPFRYDEWDYNVQLARPDWVTLFESRQAKGDPQIMDNILEKYKPVASRIKHLIDAMQPQGLIRRRGYEEGEELDLNAAIRAMVDIRRGIMPNPRINIRITRYIRDLAIVVLIDLSESTNEKVGENQSDDGNPQTILSLTREATGLLSWAIDAIGDNFAVHGFASDGRHDVQYYRFKNFNQRYDEEAKARIAGMKGGLSTRMGAALRHAGEHLVRQDVSKRLVLLVTDGEPADIDERDPQYLRHDAKKAVDDNAMKGVHTFCLTLDPKADQYVSRIFGANNYSIVDNVERLPERLPNLFATLTG
jgi:nitric oxide reductase NorD protein